MTVNLRAFLRPGLDVLFVALNPPVQSNANGHYFSGHNSRFFELLHLSGLITRPLPKETADEIVFGSTAVNYRGRNYGVVDLVEDTVETDSGSVSPSDRDVERLLQRIRQSEPRFVCIIHSKVRDALNRRRDFGGLHEYGMCGPQLRGSPAQFVLNWFPNGNNIRDDRKLAIFRELRNAL